MRLDIVGQQKKKFLSINDAYVILHKCNVMLHLALFGIWPFFWLRRMKDYHGCRGKDMMQQAEIFLENLTKSFFGP